MKPRSLEQLCDGLDRELAWRQKELADAALSIRTAEGTRQAMLLRAGVCLLYAHWEGFVKNAARTYIAFVSMRRLKVGELASPFTALATRRAAGLDSNELTPANFLRIIDYLRRAQDQRASISTSYVVATQSNLSSDVLRQILLTVGLDYAGFELKAQLIDRGLLHSRNEIAHGEWSCPKLADYEGLHREVVGLIRLFKDQVTNAAAKGEYRRVPLRQSGSAA